MALSGVIPSGEDLCAAKSRLLFLLCPSASETSPRLIVLLFMERGTRDSDALLAWPQRDCFTQQNALSHELLANRCVCKPANARTTLFRSGRSSLTVHRTAARHEQSNFTSTLNGRQRFEHLYATCRHQQDPGLLLMSRPCDRSCQHMRFSKRC